MIGFNVTDVKFNLKNKQVYKKWLTAIIENEGKKAGDISYVFCSDEYLLDLNKQYLNHDTYTDIITFDYAEGNKTSGDIFISIDRVKENAGKFNVTFEEELLRVMAHGVLHLMGYKDKKSGDISIMRSKEEESIEMFNNFILK